jgi:hypothetical protein
MGPTYLRWPYSVRAPQRQKLTLLAQKCGETSVASHHY